MLHSKKLIQIPIFHFCYFLNICFVLQPLSYLYRHFPSRLIIFPLLCSGFQNQESFLWIFLYFSSHVYFMSNLNLWQFLSIFTPKSISLGSKASQPLYYDDLSSLHVNDRLLVCPFSCLS